MAVCKSCGKRWGFINVAKVVFAKGGVECPNCKRKQYLSSSSLINLSFASTFFFLLIIMPFLVRLSNKEEQIY